MTDVLVVGAGIAGLTVAADLQRRGLSVRVAERVRVMRMPTAGIVLHPNAMACLGHLRQTLHARGAQIERQVAIDPDGVRTVVDWQDVWRAQDLPVAVHRRTLGELLFEGLEPDTVMWSTTPRDLIQDSDGVTVTFDGGHTARYKLVVGADGINSWVRRAVDRDAVPRYTGHTFVRTTVRQDGLPPSREWRTWRSAPYFFGAMPVGQGRMAVFLQIASREPLHIEPDDALALLHAAVRSMPAEVGDLVALMRLDEDLVTRAAFALATNRSVSGRVVLIGDAAQAVSPSTTQGGGLAIEDATVLGEEVTAHGCGPAALAAFEQRRRPRVSRFQKTASQHVTLMEAVQRAPRAQHRAPGDTTVDASRWYRRLYAPLLDAP